MVTPSKAVKKNGFGLSYDVLKLMWAANPYHLHGHQAMGDLDFTKGQWEYVFEHISIDIS